MRRRDRERYAVIYLVLTFGLFGMSMARLRRPPRAMWLRVGVRVAVAIGAYVEWGVLAPRVAAAVSK